MWCRLYYPMLGAIAGLIVGILPSFLVFVVSNGAYAIGTLIGFVMAGAIMGGKLGKKIELLYEYMLEFLTSEAW